MRRDPEASSERLRALQPLPACHQLCSESGGWATTAGAWLQQGLLSSVSDGVPHARGCRCFFINCLEKLLQAQLIRFPERLPFLSFFFISYR